MVATIEEAGPLIERLGARLLRESPFATYRFDAKGDRPGGFLIVSGMGSGCAADATRYAVVKRGVRTLVNVGVCGSLGTAVAGTVFAVDGVVAGDTPGAPVVPLDPGPWRGLPQARLVTVVEPVFGGARRDRLAGVAQIVDMEGAAVVRVAGELGARCVLIKGVTDSAADGERETLRSNLAAVSEQVAGVVAEGLPALGQVRRGLIGRLMALIKVEHSIFSLPLLFAGAWIGAGNCLPPLRTVGWVVVAGVAARGLGMVANRLLDRDMDALNRRTVTRELASGTMTPIAGWSLALLALVVYLFACSALGMLCLRLSVIPAVMLVGYSLLKRFTVLCHFGIGACMAMAPVGAHVAVRGDLEVTAPLVLIAGFAFFWISGFDIIYALQDMDSDRENGVRSIPVRLGAVGAQWVAGAAHGLAVAALLALWWIQGGQMVPGVLVSVSLLAFMAAYLPGIPVAIRFFPISAIAGVAGAFVPMVGGLL
jgi:4-hydroxybenzoate polyprenyltransferase